MQLQKFLHYHFSVDPRRDEILELISNLDKETHFLNKEINSTFISRLMLYISWLIHNSGKTSQEIANVIFEDLKRYS